MADEPLKIELPEPQEDEGFGALIDTVDGVLSESAEPKFNDITDATAFPPQMDFPLWLILIGLGVLILLVTLFLAFKKSRKTGILRPNYYNAALKRLPGISQKTGAQSLGQTASDLSLLLRAALRKATQSPALFQTQTEFLSSDAIQMEDASLATETIEHLNHLWSLEYAPPVNDSSRADELVSSSEALLKKLSSART